MKLVEQFHFEPSLIEEIEVFSPPSKYFQDNIGDLSPEETQMLVNLLNKYFLKSKLREESLEYMQHQYEMAQRKYVDLFYFSPTGYLILDREGQILESNLTATNLLGYPNSAIIGKCLNNFLPEKDVAILEAHFDALVGGERKSICEVTLINKNQSQTNVLMESILWPDELGELTHIRTAVIDISEKKNLETKVTNQAKMEAVDSLVGSIAHDFNNILHSIISNTEFLVHGDNVSEDVNNHLNRILDLSSRAADSITQLLEIGSQSATSQKFIKGHTFIEQIKPALEKFIPQTIETEWRIQDEQYSIKIDSEQIQIILINLLLNSVSAMSNGGAMTIDLYKYQPSKIPNSPIPPSSKAEWIVVRVTDNGQGIHPEKLKSLFTPNFTLNVNGKRKGLNLLRARGIMNQHDGHIHVDSTLGVGTSVSLYFPAYQFEQPIYNTPFSDHSSELIDATGKSLLLVEDQVEVAQSFSEILEFLGFEVIVAINGKDGLALFENYHKKIDVVITDLLMPEMDGETFLKTIRMTNSDVKIIVASGNPISKRVNELYQWNISGYVQKPFTINKISSILKSALEVELPQLT